MLASIISNPLTANDILVFLENAAQNP
jgi:hypothetical protein